MAIRKRWGMSSIAQRKDAAKYKAILDAAIKVMAQTGYHGAQVARIAREAGVADGTVYLYFKNKEDILISILRETIGQIVLLSNWLEGDHPEPLIALKKLIEAHFTTLGSNPELALVLQVHIRQSEKEIRQQVADMMRPYQQTLRRIITLGQQTGVFLPAVDAQIARRMIFGTIDETVNAWIYTGAKYDLTTLIEPVYATLLHGIGA
jgi:TetR/AcrR family fatty acid metabolism transcriptional regulator